MSLSLQLKIKIVVLMAKYGSQNVYKTPLQDLNDLKIRIANEIKIIKKETLRDVFSESVKRLNFCIEVEGNTFEQYL